MKSLILSLALIAGGFAALVAIGPMVDAAKPKLPESFSDSDLNMKGAKLKGFAVGMEGLLADWYYIRGLQYLGNKMLNSKDPSINMENLSSLKPRLLYPFLDSATDLDPHYIGAYLYGAIVLPAVDKEKAIAFAEKGIRDNPTEWRLYQYLGFIHWRLGDYEKAAATYEKGAQIPGASQFMSLMAASMKLEGGSRSTARAIYRQMLTESGDEAVRITAERRLAELDWFDEHDALRAVLQTYKEKTGRCADRLAEILPQIRQVRLPEGNEFQINAANELVDPSGVPYLLDREKCDVSLDADKTKVPIQ